MTSDTKHPQFDWCKPLLSAVVALLLSLLLTLDGNDIDWLLYAVGVIALGASILLSVASFRRLREQRITALAVFVAYVAVTALFFANYSQLRPTLRWVLSSQRYKAELLKQPPPLTGQLKHLEWESSGWGPIGPTMVYLVLDPDDALSAAAKGHRAGQFSGIPCEVPRVQRLESQWYAVTFYTEERWGENNRLNCRGSGT